VASVDSAVARWASSRVAVLARYPALMSVPVLAGWSTGSVPLGFAVLIALVTGVVLVRKLVRTRRHLRRLTRHRDLLMALKGQLASGTSLQRALAQETSGGSAEAKALSRLVGRTGGALQGPSAGGPVVGATELELATSAAIDLSHQLGIPLAGILDRLAQTADAELTLAGQHGAATAGARVSAAVLTALPALGVALGAGMGANPLPVLVHSSTGGILLIGGVALACAGLLWSSRITGLGLR
jgi:tight adherence protein B